MSDLKLAFLPTSETRRNTQVNTLTFKQQFRYDINDYLPTQFSEPYYKSTYFNKAHISSRVTRAQMLPSIEMNSEEQLFSKTERVCESDLDEQNKVSLKAYENAQNAYKQKIIQLEAEVEMWKQKTHASQSENYQNLDKLIDMQQSFNKQLQQKQQLNSELAIIKSEMQRKLNNLRFYNQIYNMTVQPRQRSTYTIEVQTENSSTSLRAQNSLPIITEPQNNMRLGNKKTQTFYDLYQKYQSHDQNQPVDNKLAKAKQIPRKPWIFETSATNRDKQNDRSLINRKIEPHSIDQILKPGLRIKNEVLQICPIADQSVEDVVQCILANL